MRIFQEDIHELVDQEARVDQLIAHVKEQLKKMVSLRFFKKLYIRTY